MYTKYFEEQYLAANIHYIHVFEGCSECEIYSIYMLHFCQMTITLCTNVHHLMHLQLNLFSGDAIINQHGMCHGMTFNYIRDFIDLQFTPCIPTILFYELVLVFHFSVIFNKYCG